MPADFAGGMPEQQWWDVVAFLLARNGVALGEAPLDATNADAVAMPSPRGGVRE